MALVVTVSLMLAFMGPPIAAFALDEPPSTTSGGLVFKLNEATGTAEVSGRSNASLEVHIPETVTSNGRTYTVTSIGWGGFSLSRAHLGDDAKHDHRH